jgi:copper homeostasis protein
MAELLVEAVCCSADDCGEAEAGGADRVELCSAMALGGLTPSLGTLIEARGRTRLAMVSMVRPRAGGFAYSAGEFAAMRRDAELAVSHGADGIVFGMLRPDGAVDVERCAELVAIATAAGRQTVFHRAFDVVPEPFSALEVLISLGITRILTSGRQPSALAGAELIRQLVERAAGRIEILPGGGIRDTNVAELLRATGVRAVHLAPFATHPDPSGQANPALSFGGAQIPPEGAFERTDAAALRRVRHMATRSDPAFGA